MIFFWLTLVDIYCLEFISHHAKEILHVGEYKLRGKPIMKKSKNVYLCLILMLKKPFFLNLKLNLFMNNLHKHLFRSSRWQMFFKINALKNFTILRIKQRLQQRCFPLRSSHMVLTYWQIFLQNTYHKLLLSCECCKVFKNSFFLQNTTGGCFCIFLKK